MKDEPPPIPEEDEQPISEDALDVDVNDLEKQSDDVVKEQDVVLDKDAIETEITQVIETSDEQVQAVENEKISITPLQENNLQVIDDISPAVTQSNEAIGQSPELKQTLGNSTVDSTE